MSDRANNETKYIVTKGWRGREGRNDDHNRKDDDAPLTKHRPLPNKIHGPMRAKPGITVTK